jgi:hypothetical protein
MIVRRNKPRLFSGSGLAESAPSFNGRLLRWLDFCDGFMPPHGAWQPTLGGWRNTTYRVRWNQDLSAIGFSIRVSGLESPLRYHLSPHSSDSIRKGLLAK